MANNRCQREGKHRDQARAQRITDTPRSQPVIGDGEVLDAEALESDDPSGMQPDGEPQGPGSQASTGEYHADGKQGGEVGDEKARMGEME